MFPAFPALLPTLLASLSTSPAGALVVATATLAYVLTQRDVDAHLRVS